MPQAVQVKVRERRLRASKIAQPAIQHRPCAAKIPPRLVMKRDRKLDQSLKMLTRRIRGGPFTPQVLERFVRLEELAVIEQPECVI